jgi:hypothetical protein
MLPMRRLSSSDIQFRLYLHMLPMRKLIRSDIQFQPYLHMLPMRRLNRSDIQYRPYIHMLPMRRLSRSDIQYRHYLHMLPREDSVAQIYIYRSYLHMLRREDSVDQIYNTDPIYICYREKIQSLKYTIPALSTYVTTRRLSRSDIQYRLYLNMLPWEDAVDQTYNTGPIYIYYHEKSQFIRYTKPTVSTYVTKRWRSRSDIKYRSYLQMLTMRRLSRSDIQFRPYLHVSMRRLSSPDIQYRPYLHMLPW